MPPIDARRFDPSAESPVRRPAADAAPNARALGLLHPFRLAAAGFAAVLGGCMVGPHYHAPQPKLPPSYSEAKPAASESPEALETWWTTFHDPTLDSLIERALRNNRDLQVAASRIREARWERVVAAGGLLPNLDATGGYDRGLGSKNVVLPFGAGAGGTGSGGARSDPPSGPGLRPQEVPGSSGGSGSAGGAASGGSSAVPPGGPNNPLGEGGFPGITTSLYQAGFDASWELDLFGGARRAVQAADATIAAAQDQASAVRVSLLAEVAETYVQLRAEQTRERLAKRDLKDEEELLSIARDKFRAGLMTEDLVAQQEAQVDATKATLPPLVASEHASRHALAFLLDENPGALDAELGPAKPLPALPDALPVGLPSDLLRRRPDIRQAERQLAAATAEVGEAVARLFPSFSLTGTFGWDSSALKSLPDWASHYYSISPGIDWPLLDWKQLRAAVHIQSEAQQQAFLAYRTSVAQALRDVEDALVQYESDRTRRQALAAAAAASRRALTVARQTYANGLSNVLATLDAERTLVQSEDALSQGDAALRTDLIALYKALGGGWSPAGSKVAQG
ncbi:MAG: efflux transporter outer membrane subunit [Opitutaceae bacterium]